jgi:hypothetical protein
MDTTQLRFISLITWNHKTFSNWTIALVSCSIELVLKGLRTLELVFSYIHTYWCCSCSSLNQSKDIWKNNSKNIWVCVLTHKHPCMQNIIGGHIFHVIKAHDLIQNIFITRVSFKGEKMWKTIFLQIFHNGRNVRKKRCKQLNIDNRRL